jgi:hypothetical protein
MTAAEREAWLDRLCRLRLLGTDHPDTLRTRNNLAYAYQAAGNLPEPGTWEDPVPRRRSSRGSGGSE